MFLSGMLARGRTRVKADRLASLAGLVRWLPTAIWVGGIFYLSQQSDPPAGTTTGGEAVLAHLILYTGLALLLAWALAGGLANHAGAPAWALAGVAFALTVLYGAVDEVHQAFVPGRSASEADLALDAAGAALGVGLALLAPRLLKGRGSRR